MNDHRLSIQRACRIVGLSWTAFYRSPEDAAARDPGSSPCSTRSSPDGLGGASGSATTGCDVTPIFRSHLELE